MCGLPIAPPTVEDWDLTQDGHSWQDCVEAGPSIDAIIEELERKCQPDCDDPTGKDGEQAGPDRLGTECAGRNLGDVHQGGVALGELLAQLKRIQP